MSLDDVEWLACGRLGKKKVEESISKTLLCQSRGNPLLVCEMLDVMYKENEECTDSAAAGALSKVEELLLNRLDELPSVDRAHLNLGAIFGFTFAEENVTLVMEIYNDVEEEDKARHAANVHSSLQESVECGILKCSDTGGNTLFSFSHVLWMKTITLHILDSWKAGRRKCAN